MNRFIDVIKLQIALALVPCFMVFSLTPADALADEQDLKNCVKKAKEEYEKACPASLSPFAAARCAEDAEIHLQYEVARCILAEQQQL